MVTLLFLLLIVGSFLAVRLYNRLKLLAEAVRSRRANILAVTRKRADLANRLVDIANGYGSHEKVAHLQVSEDMTTMATAANTNARADHAIREVAALAMAFPDLKANQTFQQLMLQLEKIESEILQRREQYNGAVEAYNGYRVRLPQSLLAGVCNFEEAPYFETSAAGLDTLAEFKTGDTKAVEQLLRRGAERARTVAAATHAQWRESQARGTESAAVGVEHPQAVTPDEFEP